MKLKYTSIRWKLLIAAVLFVTFLTIIFGVTAYSTFREDAFRKIGRELGIIASDWNIITDTYVQQMDRVIKREDSLVRQRLSTIALDVEKMLSFAYYHSDNLTSSEQEVLHNGIANITIGRSGYVFLLDSQGNYIVSKDRLRDSTNIFYSRDEQGNFFIQSMINEAKKLQSDEVYFSSFLWNDTGDTQQRELLVATAYFREKDIIIGAASYYTDFRSDELQSILQEEIKSQMAAQQIGKTGYIWVVDPEGNYIVSKDRLRDGENIIETKDEHDEYFVKEVIEKGIALQKGETYTRYYFWKNPGEEKTKLKVAVVTYNPSWKWVIGASAYEDDFLGALYSFRTSLFIISILAILLGSAIAYVIALYIIGPLLKLEGIVIKGTGGNLAARAEDSITRRTDEVGSLARSFNTMISNLQQKMSESEREITERKKSERELLKKSKELIKFNDFAIGRELQLIELKKKLRDIEDREKDISSLPPSQQ